MPTLGCVSKAFTKEDDGGGVAVPTSASFVVPSGPFRLTAEGARRLSASQDARLREQLARAEILTPVPVSPPRATLGVTVHAVDASGEARAFRLVTPEERGLLGEGCSVQSPVGQALLGSTVGDTREIRAPRGALELEILELEGELGVGR